MASLQITCINKDNRLSPYERITHVGGAGFKYTTDEAIRYIKSETHSFYVSVAGDRVAVRVASKNGREYLRTEADGDEPNNLLSLPECR